MNATHAFVNPNDSTAGANMTTSGPPLATIAKSLRERRERAGLSLTELARRAGIAKSTLSQLEAATGNPSVETLWALAVALDVPFSQLVEPPAAPVRVVRASERPGVHAEQAHFTGSLLAAGPPHARRDVYVISLEPGADRHALAHIAGTVEHLIVAAGRVRTGPADQVIELGPGDYAAFPGDVAHVYEAVEPGTWAVLVMEHR
jgi:transcriptional regulator with XRE-family HTH domain